MERIDEISRMLQVLILAGVGVRLIYIFIKLTHEEEEAPRYKKRLKNTIIFAILSQLAFVIKDIIFSYLGG